MPRDIPIGNGNLLVTFDADYSIRDIHWPYVGGENHTAGHPFRFGLWVAPDRPAGTGGRFCWSGDFERHLDYKGDTLLTRATLKRADLGIRIACEDGVDFHEDLFIRRVTVTNLWDVPRTVKLFFHHDFHLSGHEVGDTAVYDPAHAAMIHYKGCRYFLVGILGSDGDGIREYATGRKEVDGLEGTWRDAEDGRLEMDPIEQGSVDSTVAAPSALPPRGKGVVYYWIAAGHSYEEVARLHTMVRERGPNSFLIRTENYWKLWLAKGAVGRNLLEADPLGGGEGQDTRLLPAPVARLFKRSLAVIRTQIDNRGAIIAANDTDIARHGRDTYSYMWPRDGALVASVLDRAGYAELARRFFQFCRDAITPEGYLRHKYNPDKSPGSSWHPLTHGDGLPPLPIQEDETALVLWALWEHFVRWRDVEFIHELFRPLIVRAGEFLTRYRDEETGLPLPSYDLWEEVSGVSAFTAATVVAGLRAAAAFTGAFGETTLQERFRRAADEVRDGIERCLYRPELGRFARRLIQRSRAYEVDPVVDASLFGLTVFGVFDPRDERIERTVAAIRERLWIKTPIGGIARYEGDRYQAIEGNPGAARIPGNPWIICTLWLADHLIARADREEDLREALDLLGWVTDRALPSGVLAEQLHPHTGEPLSVAPLTWSHAAFAGTVLAYLAKRADLVRCPTCGRAPSAGWSDSSALRIPSAGD